MKAFLQRSLSLLLLCLGFACGGGGGGGGGGSSSNPAEAIASLSALTSQDIQDMATGLFLSFDLCFSAEAGFEELNTIAGLTQNDDSGFPFDSNCISHSDTDTNGDGLKDKTVATLNACQDVGDPTKLDGSITGQIFLGANETLATLSPSCQGNLTDPQHAIFIDGTLTLTNTSSGKSTSVNYDINYAYGIPQPGDLWIFSGKVNTGEFTFANGAKAKLSSDFCAIQHDLGQTIDLDLEILNHVTGAKIGTIRFTEPQDGLQVVYGFNILDSSGTQIGHGTVNVDQGGVTLSFP